MFYNKLTVFYVATLIYITTGLDLKSIDTTYQVKMSSEKPQVEVNCIGAVIDVDRIMSSLSCSRNFANYDLSNGNLGNFGNTHGLATNESSDLAIYALKDDISEIEPIKLQTNPLKERTKVLVQGYVDKELKQIESHVARVVLSEGLITLENSEEIDNVFEDSILVINKDTNELCALTVYPWSKTRSVLIDLTNLKNKNLIQNFENNFKSTEALEQLAHEQFWKPIHETG